MLSVKKLSMGQASTYYSNYYTKTVGEYVGKLKNELGLSDLTHESFNQLLRGVNPKTREQLIHSKASKKGVVPAFDFTFSPPKSISLAYELANEKGDNNLLTRLTKAHDYAVNAALSHIEQEHIKARVQKNKRRVSKKTENFIAAKFQHDINRNLEPQLHTHSVIMNFSKIDGKYRAIDASNLLKKGSKIVKNLGQFYRQSLKEELLKNGLELRETNQKESFFELREIDDDLIQAFSNRSHQIKNEVIKLKKKFPNLSESQLNLRAFFKTRKTKKDVDRDKVRSKNIELMSKHTDINSLLKKLNRKSELKQNVIIPNEREFAVLLDQVKHNINNKYHRTLLNMATKIAAKIDIPIHQAYQKIKTKEQQDKKELKTMHEVVVLNLEKTRLDTEKLYSSFNRNENKLILEEHFENRRVGKTSHRDRFIEISSRVSNEFAEAKRTHLRDVANTATRAERRERGANIERVDDVIAGDARRDIKTSQAVTIEDVKLAERGYRESVNNNKEKEL